MNAESVVRIWITGVVQGVGFRWAMTHEARRLGVSGWVRNRREGAVEALIAGPEHAVEKMVEWARQGPPAARVMRVERMPVEAFEKIPTDFSEAPTV